MTEFPDEFKGKRPHFNKFEDKDDPKALEYVRIMSEVYRQLEAGTLYIKFVSGDRKGAIARVSPNTKTFGENAVRPISIEYNPYYYSRNDKAVYDFKNDRCYGICQWDGRKNKVQVNLPDNDVVFLLNYNGPTVWSLFDAKSAKEEVLKNPNQLDIDGNVLSIGDPVLYINARYGSRMELEHGNIKEFTAVVNSTKSEIFTVVENKEGTLSTITNSEYMIYKKENIS